LRDSSAISSSMDCVRYCAINFFSGVGSASPAARDAPNQQRQCTVERLAEQDPDRDVGRQKQRRAGRTFGNRGDQEQRAERHAVTSERTFT